MTVCSTAFETLGRAQSKGLAHPDLPIAFVPHPFGAIKRDAIRELALKCAYDIAYLVSPAAAPAATKADTNLRAPMIQLADDIEAVNRHFREQRWTDGFPVIPPTPERVERMLRCSSRNAHDVVGLVAPGYGAATVERIAINAVMAGCDPEYLPVLIAAVDAIASPQFNLQGIQATTNPVGAWLIVNGPIAKKLNMNSGANCLGQGNWANATLGRALRLIMQNIGRAMPGEMDRATQGYPGKYSFCCAENEDDSPWEPLHVERGFQPGQSTVTVVGAEGIVNMNTRTKIVSEVIRVFAQCMPRPAGNDYRTGGQPWIVLCPEYADILAGGGLTKAEVKRLIWEQSRMPATQYAAIDFELVQHSRRATLGEITRDSRIPACATPEDIGILVAGGAGTHAAYVQSFGNTRSVTREIV